MFKKRFKTSTIPWVLGMVKNRVPNLIFLTLLSVAEGFLGVMFALGTQGVIDSAVQGQWNALLWACIRLGGLIGGTILCSVLTRHINDKLEADLDRDLKRRFMHRILHGEYGQISKFHSGDLVHRLNADIRVITDTLMHIFPNIASLCVRTFAVIGVLSGISPMFTLALLALSIFVSLGMLAMRRILKNLNKQINDSSGRISGFLQEIIEKLLIVQALDVAQMVETREEDLLERRWQLQKRRKNLNILSSSGISFLGYIVSFVTLVWCARRLMLGQMSFGALTSTTQLSKQLEMPMYILPSLMQQLISMSASAERLMELEKIEQVDEGNIPDAGALYDRVDALSAENLTFGYGESPVLNHVHFIIPKGSLTVIMGPSGIGKSTLLKLLLGIYHPSAGTLSLQTSEGDIPITRKTRSLFSYVPQGNLLLSGTLRENLTFARPNAAEEEIQQAVYVSAMDDYVSQLPQGLDTYLGENAAGLSEGQAQRLSLARAILSQAPILLLDEVTSALDGETERKVLTRIRQLENRTCIAVTHRPAVLELADWELIVSDSEIQCGTISAPSLQKEEVFQ